ncbi:MAG: MBL fold metallo-hydrolase, partial [Mesorhizobium sp.]
MSADPTRDRLVLLGSKGGPALRPGGPWPSSSVLEIGGRYIVVDCGLGVTRGLADAGISPKALDLVFITHLHSDHVLELGPLVHTAWTAGLATPVTVFGPPGTGHYWQRFCQAMEFDIETRIVDEGRPDIEDMVSIVEFGEGRVMEERGLKVSALRVDLPPVTD